MPRTLSLCADDSSYQSEQHGYTCSHFMGTVCKGAGAKFGLNETRLLLSCPEACVDGVVPTCCEHPSNCENATASAPLPTPEPTPMGTPEPTPEATPEPTPMGTPEPTPMGTPEPTPMGTPEPTPVGTPEPTPMGTPEPTPEATPEPMAEPTPEPMPEPTQASSLLARMSRGSARRDAALRKPTASAGSALHPAK
jgi:hypothetical protein